MFPAHAGMNRAVSKGDVQLADVPRTRGDEPIAWDVLRDSSRCSPHTRG